MFLLRLILNKKIRLLIVYFQCIRNTKTIHLVMMIWLFRFTVSNYKLASSPPKNPGGSKKILSKSRI